MLKTLIMDTSRLSERSLYLFKSLVEHFIMDGQPVGSRTLARDIGSDLSPATIRNVMADLEDLGLLTSPHTSAGRVPTAKGYRLFVDSLLRVDKLDQRQAERIAKELEWGGDVHSLLEKTSEMLSEITSLAGIVMLPRANPQALRQVEFLSLSDNRVLVILVVNEEEIQNRIIHTNRTYTPAELQQAANYLNAMYSGKDLKRVRQEILAELHKMREDVNVSMQLAIEMAQKAFAQETPGPRSDYLLTGHTNLMNVAELSNLDKLKKLFDSFNQKRDILHLLEQAVNAHGVQIFIGEESGYEVLDDCSIVTSPYEVDGQILGVLGVLGPTRMNYERVIPVVDITAKMLGMALNSSN
ncbi:MAG: heat-inducible transcriptional repressor HrcA [Gammaproteobacteria bacterium RIFCSPLOWO2_02_FULL_56_15]|nr:MAG: heat-inducible transcriptional repressor HrcA [Gammaproteobacteria bacterium RIFCSPLOWO2_02_FULL_56_15]